MISERLEDNMTMCNIEENHDVNWCYKRTKVPPICLNFDRWRTVIRSYHSDFSIFISVQSIRAQIHKNAIKLHGSSTG